MRSLHFIWIALCLSCEKVEILRVVPDCIESKIEEFAKTDSTCEAGAEVSEYSFQGQTVYTFFDGSCGADRGTQIFSNECQFVGYLGGIGNLQVVNGEVFSTTAIYIGKVWGN